jgi:hypothetical protein
MTQEAMKQALEALEDFVDVIKYDNEQDDIGRRACCDVLSYNPHSESCKAIKSIASLCQAIAELESQERNYCTRCGKRTNDIHTCTPPQRSESSGKPSAWVGLTDDEISALSKGHIVRSTYARAIEAHLKQKNGFAEEKNT